MTWTPEEKDQNPAQQRPGGRRTFTRRTRRLPPPPERPPQREKTGGKDAPTISCMVELFVGSNRRTAGSGDTSGEGGDAGAPPRYPNSKRTTRSHDQVGKSLPVSAPTG